MQTQTGELLMDKFKKKLTIGLVVLVFAGAIGMSLPVFAHGDSGTSSSDSDADSASHARELMEKFKLQGRERSQALRANAVERTHEQRQKSCEARKEGLVRRMDRAVTQAEKHKAVFDKIYTRVMKFHDDKNLTTPNYDELLAKVNSAQSDAADGVAALSSLNIEIDCTQDNVADGVSSFKEALGDTRDSLKAYRKAIVELIKAVHQSVTESNDNNNSGQQ